MDFLKGKKTYVLVGLFVVLFILSAVVGLAVPEAVWAILAALGVAAVRSALADISGNNGWKTYVAAVAVVIISLLSELGVALPLEIVYSVLTALGVVGVRDAINKIK